jgi:hypothetical protein
LNASTRLRLLRPSNVVVLGSFGTDGGSPENTAVGVRATIVGTPPANNVGAAATTASPSAPGQVSVEGFVRKLPAGTYNFRLLVSASAGGSPVANPGLNIDNKTLVAIASPS